MQQLWCLESWDLGPWLIPSASVQVGQVLQTVPTQAGSLPVTKVLSCASEMTQHFGPETSKMRRKMQHRFFTSTCVLTLIQRTAGPGNRLIAWACVHILCSGSLSFRSPLVRWSTLIDVWNTAGAKVTAQRCVPPDRDPHPYCKLCSTGPDM